MEQQEYQKLSKSIKNYKVARTNVLLLLAITLANIFFLLLADRYLLFSIYTVVLFTAVGAVQAEAFGSNGLSGDGNRYRRGEFWRYLPSFGFCLKRRAGQ